MRFIAFLLLCLLAFSDYATSGPKERVGPPLTEIEKQMLPPYCKARLYGPESEYQRWRRKWGSNFSWINHYCKKLNRRRKCETMINTEEKMQCLSRFLNEYKYIFDNTSKNFQLRPLLYLERGETYIKLGQFSNAEQDFLKVIKKRPKYAKSYALLSDLYLQIGDKEKAISVLETGLKFVPSSKNLKKRLSRLTDS